MEPRLHDPKFERAAREEIERYQTTRVSALVAETWRRNAFYRDHWTAMGAQARDIRTLADFASSVPIVRKADFVADQAGAPPYGKRLAAVTAGAEPFLVFNTSGTSGQGVELHAATYAERRRAFSVSAYFYRWAGLVPGDRVFLCYPVSMLGGGRIEIYGLEDYGLTVFPVATYDVGRKLELMEKFKPHAIMATTSYIGHMAAVGLERGSLQAVKALMGGGEGAGYSWFEQQERLWQAPFFNHYGATQTRVDHMYPCEHGIGTRERPGLMHNIEPGFLIEVIDPATGRHVGDGEHGEIVVTSLIHDTFPLIRYAMGDAGIYHDARYCPCGRPFAGVEIGSVSRIDDMKKVKGINIWPQAVDEAVFRHGGVDEYQVVLTRDAHAADVATIRVMAKPDVAETDRVPLCEAIAAEARRRIGIRFEVESVPPGGLPRSEYKARRWLDRRNES